jgi:hypothetical protein
MMARLILNIAPRWQESHKTEARNRGNSFIRAPSVSTATVGTLYCRHALQTISRSHGLFIIASMASGDQARELPELGHGALTYTLLAGLGEVDRSLAGLPTLQPPDDEAVLTVSDWFRFARDRAPALSERFFGGEQRIGFERRGEDFPILRLTQ